MFKKAFQIVVTFGLLVGAYQGYLLAFAALTERVARARPMPPSLLVHTDSKTAMEATRLAVESFGVRAWQANPRLPIRVYDKERGFYLYAQSYERKDGGKVFIFHPFAIIWLDKGGKARKIATSEWATVTLNEPLGVLRPGSEAIHVVAAKLEQDVFLRDDKGTPRDPSDDLIVRGPEEGVGLPYIEYTEKTDPPEIRTTCAIHLADRDTTVDGVGMLILLRKRDGGTGTAGFDARTAFLYKDVRIVARNGGKANVLPGTARGTKGDGPTPLFVRSDSQMRIDFPRKPSPPLAKWQQGPPDLEGPTSATFARNVEVVRGVVAPDSMASDTLELTFLPTERPFHAVAPPEAPAIVLGLASVLPGGGGFTPRAGGDPGGDGPLTELTLRKAIAKGYAVWLRSSSQDTTAKCNELIHKKFLPEAPDETYLRADSGRQIYVEKLELAGPADKPGAVASVMSFYAPDAKIFDEGKGGASTVVARGPGLLEVRPSRDRSVERSATWTQNLEVRTIGTPGPASGRQITLTGPSRLVEHLKETAIKAQASIVIRLRPKTVVAGASRPAAGASGLTGGDGGDFEVEHLTAREAVVLTAPGKTIEARDTLDAPFESVVAAVAAAPAATGKPEAAATPDPFPALASADKPATAPGTEKAKADPKAVATKKAEPGDDRRAAPEQAVHVKAHRIYAQIRQGETVEIHRAWLSGGVKVRQEPAPGKLRGLDVTGESTYIESVGKGLYQARAWNTDRSGMAVDRRLAANDGARIDRPVLASIETEDYIIRGPAIAMDQSTDIAWVNGAGHLIQLAGPGLLSDKGLKARNKGAGDGKAPLTLTISWTRGMQFTGRTVDPKGQPSAKGEFYGQVDAAMVNSRIIADELFTWTDRPVSLASPRTKGAKLLALDEGGDPGVVAAGVNLEDVPPAGREPGAAEPRAELAYLEARNAKVKDPNWPRVTIINIKQSEKAAERVERQRIEGPIVKYDKRSGDYHVDGRGEVWLWRRTGPDPSPSPARPVKPAALLRDGRPAPKAEAPRAVEPPWDLTHIEFADYMVGRFGTAKEGEDPDPRTADFYGAKVVNGKVFSDESNLDWAQSTWKPANKVKYMTSYALRVIDEPPPAGVKDRPARQYLTADGNAHAYSEGRAVVGNYMTYDTEKGLFYAYGDENSNAAIVDQSQPGQSFSLAQGSTVFFNTKTHESGLIDPTQIHLFDRKGERGGPGGGPPGPEKEEKRRRPDLRPPSPSHIERRGFSGR